jgi:thiamine pyrophosphate-dependent acetolactate synthase large subunit-like protein
MKKTLSRYSGWIQIDQSGRTAREVDMGTLADELVDILAKAGVQRIYGIVGDSLNPVTDAVRRSGKIQWVHMRHEETGAFAAGTEAQLSGKLVACAGSCGLGNLHLINGLCDAHVDEVVATVEANWRTI